MKQDYQSLIERIAELEAERSHGERIASHAEQRLEDVSQFSHRQEHQLKVLQTLASPLVSELKPSELYHEVCDLAVKRLGWGKCAVVTFKGQRVSIAAHCGFTAEQLNHVRDYASSQAHFQSYAHDRSVFNTFHKEDRTDLALRVLFSADEVIGVPLLHGTTFFGYLVVTLDGHRVPAHWRIEQEINYLATLASFVAYYVHSHQGYSTLEERNAELQRIAELKNSFISITSHQLRTPLSIIKWILYTLRDDKEIAKLPEQRHLMNQAFESNERLIHVVNDLLNASRIQEGTLPYDPKPVDAVGMVNDLLPSLQTACHNRSITLNVKLPKGPVTVEADELILKQALQGLLDNAVDYNDQEHGSITVSLTKTERHVHVDISNRGIRIAPEDEEHIFDEFYRSDAAVRMKPDGNGMGLYLARSIVKLHGGEIHHGIHGEDTLFSVVLPLPAQTPKPKKKE